MNRILLVLSGVLAASGCKPKVRDLPICPVLVAAGKATEAETRDLSADVWFSLLVGGFDRSTMDMGDDPRDCSGQPIVVEWPASMVADPRVRARKLERGTRTDADISINEVENGELLLWARIDALENGDALGPVALVRWVERGLEIRGIGAVQAPGLRVRMRLEPLGERQRVLVLESEVCPKGTQGQCASEAQLVPLVEQRFVSAPLLEDGRDTGPARFLLNDSREEPMKDGWIRRYELQRLLTFGGGKVLLQENIRTRDCDPRSPETPCELHDADSGERAIEFKDGALHTTTGVWEHLGKPTSP